MSSTLIASDIMTPTPVTVKPQSKLVEAVRLMLQHKVSGLPVVSDNGDLAGILTEADLLRRSEVATERRRSRWLELLLGSGRLATEYAHAHGRTVREVMTSKIECANESTPVGDLVDLMEREKIKRLPILRDGKLVGIVTRADILRALARRMLKPSVGDASDAAIRDRLIAELDKQPWAPVGIIHVDVKNGVIELGGVVIDERQREALCVAAENTYGAKGVVDRLVWVEPHSGMVFP